MKKTVFICIILLLSFIDPVLGQGSPPAAALLPVSAMGIDPAKG